MESYHVFSAPRVENRATCRTSGFTLVELMVALALSIFLVGGVSLTYLSGRATSGEAETLARMQENIRFASDFLVRDVRNAGFRDHLTLTFQQYQDIGTEFAELNDSDACLPAIRPCLTVRYAGRGACGRVFSTGEELKVIQNTYYADVGADGEPTLFCDGLEISADGTITDSNPVALATRVASVGFEFVFADGAVIADPLSCDFLRVEDIPNACTGVRMTLEFEGEPNRTAVITSAFRNVIFDRIYFRKTI